jgi:hypothetical protein
MPGGKKTKANKGNFPEKGKPTGPTESESTLALMLQDRAFEIIDDGNIKDADGLNEETWATVLEKLLKNNKVMSRLCLVRFNRAIGKLDISGKFGEWLSDHGNQTVHVNMPLQVFHDMNAADPFVPMNVRRFNAGMLIREGLKSQIELMIEKNPTIVSCTDMNRLLLIVEEMDITYFPINRDGDVDRSATPLALNQSSDLCTLFKDHVIRTTVNQDKRHSTGPITFHPQFVHVFQMDASHVKMLPHWQRDECWSQGSDELIKVC